MAIGVVIPNRKIWLFVPYSMKTFCQIKSNEKFSDNTHINSLEMMAITFVFLMFKADFELHRSDYPPQSTMDYQGDSKSANSWERKSTTKSTMGQQALRYNAEYTLNCEVAFHPNHILSKDIKLADRITRVNKLFSPMKSHIYDVPYVNLLQQVCSKFTELRSWRIFLPNPDIISDMRWIFSSTSPMEEVPKPRQILGQFVPVEHIFSGTVTREGS